MTNRYNDGYPKKIQDETINTIPSDIDTTLKWVDYLIYFIKGNSIGQDCGQHGLTLKSRLKQLYIRRIQHENLSFSLKQGTKTLARYSSISLQNHRQTDNN